MGEEDENSRGALMSEGTVFVVFVPGARVFFSGGVTMTIMVKREKEDFSVLSRAREFVPPVFILLMFSFSRHGPCGCSFPCACQNKKNKEKEKKNRKFVQFIFLVRFQF